MNSKNINQSKKIEKIHHSNCFDGICGKCFSDDKWLLIEENKSDVPFWTEQIFRCQECDNERVRYYDYRDDRDSADLDK